MTNFRLNTFPDKRIFLMMALILLNGTSVFPQGGSQKDDLQTGTSTFSVGVDVVNAFVTVRDKKGSFIKDLVQEDFTLKEDGRPQIISYFSRESDLPLTIGLIVDNSPSMISVMGQLQIASQAFLKKVIRPGKDKVFIIKFRDIQNSRMSFDGQIEMLLNLTTSSELIEKAVNLIGWEGAVGPASNAEFQTMLGDSIYLAADKILKPLQGRKALIVLGDGFHIGYHMDMAVGAAQEADSLIYSIRIQDQNFGNSGGMGGGMGGPSSDVYETNLEMLSNKTGGTYFEYKGKQSLDQIYAQIEDELRSQYLLGYAPEQSNNKGFRKIKVKVQKDGMIVHAREGYYPNKKK
jgi:VWFA-related protein